MRVDVLQLAEIGELVRSGHVTDRREHGVLDQRTQQYIGAEMIGMIPRFIGKLIDRHAVLADHGRRALDANRRALGIQMKQRDGAVGQRRLRVKSLGHERVTGLGGNARGLARPADLLDEHLASQRLRGRIRRVVHH